MQFYLKVFLATKREFHAYAIWHNQITDEVTVRTETGHYKFAASEVISIEMKAAR